MKIEEQLTASVMAAVKELYGQEIAPQMVTLQKTKKEFEGNLTLVVFALLRVSRKSPEATAQEIGEYLVKNDGNVAKFNVIKGFLNLSISDSSLIELLQKIDADDDFGKKPVTDESPLVMIEYSSPNTNKPT